MKILIAYGSKGKFFHMKQFSDALKQLGVESMLVYDSDYSTGFPSKRISDWISGDKKFKELIKGFKPDAIFTDRQTHFAIHSIKAGIPIFILLRGHYLEEYFWGMKTLGNNLKIRSLIWFRNRITERVFRESTAILAICKYLEDVVKEHHPTQKTEVFFEGINSSHWYHTEGIKLEHPCVGLLQDANWWGKTKEMLVLKKVLEKMPEVTFYWAGDGPYKDQIITELNKFSNFKWLGRLDYPDKVREYLSEIDVYALISGMDLAPLTLKEAQLMEKPVVATNVGGIPEMMQDKKTGFLVNEGDSQDLIDKLSVLISDKITANKMGKEGRKFVEETFAWDKIARNFLDVIKKDAIYD